MYSLISRWMVGAMMMVCGGIAQANVINLTHPYTNTTISSVVGNAVTVDGDVILVNTNVQTEKNIGVGKNVTIKGLGMNSTILQVATNRGASAGAMFNLLGGRVVQIQDMTLRYASNNSVNYAACLDINGASTGILANCRFTANDSAFSGAGVVRVGNSASVLIVSNCEFSSNVCNSAGAVTEATGGGVLIVQNSCFFDNYTAGDGAGIDVVYNYTAGTTSLVSNCTFYRNVATGNGGAIVMKYGGTAYPNTICNCTFYTNMAANGAAIKYTGAWSTDWIKMDSCIVAGNVATNTGGMIVAGDQVGKFIVTNSILNGAASVVTAGTLYTNGCLLNVDPMLLPLANNGGPTPTLALAAGSPAINKGANPAGLANDQRGAPYQRQAGSAADMGAYEYGAGPTNLTYSRTAFAAVAPGSGVITNVPPLVLTLDWDTFSGTDGAWSTNGTLTVTNLPDGLTVSAICTNNGANLLVSLLGTATQHAASNSIVNLGFTFLGAAFQSGIAGGVNGASVTNLTITFVDPVMTGMLTYGSTNFTEDAVWNDGRIGTTNTISLSGDSFLGTNGQDFVSSGWITLPVALPAGLTAVVTRVNASNLTVTLTGRATSHAAISSVSNFELVFQNAAFQGANAGVIVNFTSPSQSILFLDPATNVQLLYGGTVFNEATVNDGSMTNAISITLTNDIFTGNDGDTFDATKVQALNLPGNLSAVVQRADPTHLSVSLTGKALSHNSVNNVNNLTLAFSNAAFYNTAAILVTNSTRPDLQIAFLNPLLTYSGTNFVEYWQNDGSIGNSLTLTLTGDTLLGTNGEDFIASGKAVPSHVPGGLTASVVRQSTNQVLFQLLGNAVAHDAPANNINNLGLAFRDGAFSFGGAGAVTNGIRSDLLVTFVGATPPSNFWVSVASGNDTTGSGSYANPWKTIAHAFVWNSPVRADANDTINVMAGIYNETNIFVNKAVTIQGAGEDLTIVQACPSYAATTNDVSRVFYPGANVVFRDMTLRYGWVTNGTQGSCIYLTGQDSIIERCRIVSNVACGVNNGGTVAMGGSSHLTMRSSQVQANVSGAGGVSVPATSSFAASNCLFAGNQSAKGGGGVYNYGSPFIMQDCVIMNNSVALPGEPGGGVRSEAYFGIYSIERCTIASNRCPGGGGGLYLRGVGTVVNSTIYGNASTNSDGGGVFVYDGATTFYNTTIAGNSAPYGTGGGMRNLYGTWSAYSTIVAGNTAGIAPDVGGILLADDHCLIGNNANSGIPAGLPNAHNSYVGTAAAPLDPLLLPPVSNGGLTPTCELQPGSRAIDKGSNPLGLTTDQRGLTNYPRASGADVDIGAFEFTWPKGVIFTMR